MLTSPYQGYPESEWIKITRQLVDDFPIPQNILVSIVEAAWEDLYSSSFGNSNLKIGQDIFLSAQAIGVILERLIAVRLANQYPDWRSGESKQEKDIVCSYNNLYSFEIKTSSSKNGIYGNRSTSYKSDYREKYRSGYYLVVNYKLPKENDLSYYIWKIRFGWIDDEDWIGQNKPTGQQAYISAKLAQLKLITLVSR